MICIAHFAVQLTQIWCKLCGRFFSGTCWFSHFEWHPIRLSLHLSIWLWPSSPRLHSCGVMYYLSCTFCITHDISEQVSGTKTLGADSWSPISWRCRSLDQTFFSSTLHRCSIGLISEIIGGQVTPWSLSCSSYYSWAIFAVWQGALPCWNGGITLLGLHLLGHLWWIFPVHLDLAFSTQCRKENTDRQCDPLYRITCSVFCTRSTWADYGANTSRC